MHIAVGSVMFARSLLVVAAFLATVPAHAGEMRPEDAKRFVAQGEKLKDTLCGAGHCPRTVLLSKASSPGAIFDLDGASADLHDRLRQLIGQIDARGLP